MAVKQRQSVELKRDKNRSDNSVREEVACKQQLIAIPTDDSISHRSVSFKAVTVNNSDMIVSRTDRAEGSKTKMNKARVDKAIYISTTMGSLHKLTKLHHLNKLILMGLCTILLLTAVPLQSAQAASSTSAMSSVDTLYDSITALERVLELQNVQIRALRQQNNAALKEVQERIRKLDSARLATMQTALKQLENRHAPLLKRYAELGKKIASARKKKDDRSVQSLLLERNGIKAQVEAARTELKNKRTELANTRKASTIRKQQLRSLLQPVQTLKKQITSENKAITAAWKIRTTARKSYHAAVRQGNAVTALAHLTVVYKQLGQVQSSRQKIVSWEQQITKTIQTVAARPDLTS
jgi:predicted  nucleic acid-binding Zn-ribbon protein